MGIQLGTSFRRLVLRRAIIVLRLNFGTLLPRNARMLRHATQIKSITRRLASANLSKELVGSESVPQIRPTGTTKTLPVRSARSKLPNGIKLHSNVRHVVKTRHLMSPLSSARQMSPAQQGLSSTRRQENAKILVAHLTNLS